MQQPGHVSAAGVVLLAGLLLAGLAALWRFAASPAARARRAPAQLAPWPGSAADLLLFFILAVAGAIAGQFLAAFALHHVTVASQEARLLLLIVGQELGMLAGVGAFFLGFCRERTRLGSAPWRALLPGLATFLVALPPVWAVSLAWQTLLQAAGLPVKEQDAITLFAGLHTPAMRLGFVAIAAIGAPVTEELLFRAGLFRFCRGRMPRWLALLAPALVFGGAHLLQSVADGLAAFAPLVALGVIFSIAYERTGRIGTTMVAHGLFNLTTMALVLLGVNT